MTSRLTRRLESPWKHNLRLFSPTDILINKWLARPVPIAIAAPSFQTSPPQHSSPLPSPPSPLLPAIRAPPLSLSLTTTVRSSRWRAIKADNKRSPSIPACWCSCCCYLLLMLNREGGVVGWGCGLVGARLVCHLCGCRSRHFCTALVAELVSHSTLPTLTKPSNCLA